MAHPVQFPQVNFTWKGWAADEERAAVGDLPAYREPARTISCWRLSWFERFRVFVTGRVWLHVHGGKQPPIYVGAEDPFLREEV